MKITRVIAGVLAVCGVAFAPWTAVALATGDYRSASSGNWETTAVWEVYNGSDWIGASGSPDSITAGVIAIRAAHNVTVTANLAVDQVVVESGGQLTVDAATLTIADGEGTDLVVHGTVRNAGTMTMTGEGVFESGGKYQHDFTTTAGTIPIATWDVNSTCEIIGYTTQTTAPTGLGQSFGNFTWNCASQTGNFQLGGGLTTVNGDLAIVSTGGGTLRLTTSTTFTLVIGGNLVIQGGTLQGATTTGNPTINLTGNLTMTGGTLDMGNGGSSGTETINVAGNVSIANGATLKKTTAAQTGNINFTKSGLQTFTSAGTISGAINWTVNSGSTVDLGGSVISGTGATFTLSPGGGLRSAHPDGLDGNLTVTGAKTFDPGADFLFNGSVSQVTGSLLPATLNNLTIANTEGVTVNGTHTVSGVCTVENGALLLGTGTINGPVILNGAVAPGGSVGTLTTGDETWNGGGSYVWEINDANGPAGTGYDLLDAGANAITIGATSENKFTLKLVTLNGAVPGAAINFDAEQSYTWTIATGGSVVDFAADKFIIDDTTFQNDTSGGVFTFEQSGGDLQLKYGLPPGGLVVGTSALPNGQLNAAYAGTLTASGGVTPYEWSVVDGSLPPGVALSPAGDFTGTPTAVGLYSFTVEVSDADDPPAVATKPLSLAITLPPPILVLTNDTNPFTEYYGEILLAEGLNSFELQNISAINSVMLADYDVVILGEMALTGGQVTDLSDWVTAGGNLIAMRPDKQLATLLGLTDAESTLSEGYLLVNNLERPGVGIVDQTIQFHGTADRYTLDTATSLAALYSDATTATVNPAVTLRSVAGNGGQAAAFTFDLARSVALTRQGNPAWVGDERDGIPPLRSSDLFFGNKIGDPQPDWVDLSKIAIPQADEQQRLLANMIIQMNADRKLLPRFWYFPNEHKAAIVMTGDDHGSGGTVGRFDDFISYSSSGASVEDWEAIRGTSYIYTNTPVTDAAAAAYVALGFEIGLHCDSGCEDYTAEELDVFFSTQFESFTNRFPSLPLPTTHRMHCIAWSGYTILPEVGRQYGIRMDTSYYYWPGNWAADWPGLFTGSGMPMRFATVNGSTIDVYQAPTQMTDESGQIYPYTADVLLDRALGQEGYYGFFVANMHTDFNEPTTPGKLGSDAIIASAVSRNVPVITARQLLTWVDGRNNSIIRTISSSLSTESFTVVAEADARGLQVMVPLRDGYSVSSVTYNGDPATHTERVVKGILYAVIPAQSGSYEVNFVPDSTPPSVTSVLPADQAEDVSLSAKVHVTFSEAMDVATINGSTIELRDSESALVAATVSYDATTFTATLVDGPLLLAETYTVTVLSGASGVKDLAGNGLNNNFIWSFTTADQVASSIWADSALPAITSANDSSPVEVGVKFQSAVPGFVTGIRFYKGAANTGTHVGTLWSAAGSPLASEAFVDESGSGWQFQAFSTPVAIDANTTYVASYHAPAGGYAVNGGFFTGSGVDNYPVRALADGEDGPNGVYRYGPSGFPSDYHNANNYWVDVVFVESVGPDEEPPTVTGVSPADAATGASLGTVVWVSFNEAMAALSVTNGVSLTNALG
ncbi:MAG: DUF4082 domain-containing protein, partial [Verrucomicrobia bacterium]|nr:DUF4082 domain-containing protein [Verrucomicrobiota bacterium]